MLPRPRITQDKDARAALAGGLALLFFVACMALADDCPEVVTKSGGHCCSNKCLASDLKNVAASVKDK